MPGTGSRFIWGEERPDNRPVDGFQRRTRDSAGVHNHPVQVGGSARPPDGRCPAALRALFRAGTSLGWCESPRGRVRPVSETVQWTVSGPNGRSPGRALPGGAMSLISGPGALSGLPVLAPRHEGQAFEEMHVLLVLKERPVQLGQRVGTVPLQILGGQILGQQEL